MCALLADEAFMVMFLLTDTIFFFFFFLKSDEESGSFSMNDTCME